MNRFASRQYDLSEQKEPERVLAASFPVGRDELRVNVVRMKPGANPVVDIRRWWWNDEANGGEGDFAPGKGFQMPIGKWNQFVESVQSINMEKCIEELERR